MELIKIGQIHSPYKQKGEAPRQGGLSSQESTLEIFSKYEEAIDGIDVSDQIVVLYWGDRADRSILRCVPHRPGETREMGVFASRSPNRPNPIALCYCEVLGISGNRMKVKGLDALDGSPILDIKIYSKEVDGDEKNR